MNCPVCENSRMREVDKDGVMIDICPQCKGVWLDRGELDKLMSSVSEIRDDFNTWYQERHRNDDREKYSNRSSDPYYKKKRKKHFLERIGDIFD